MSLTIAKRILRLLDPSGERERMEMREARCITEANAEDLMRTMRFRQGEIAEVMRKHREQCK